MVKKKCLTCKSKVIDDLESEMHKEIPEWYLKDGNYSLLPKVLTCNDKYNANKNDLVKETPNITDTEIKIPLEVSKNTWIFYWAADSNKNSTVIKNPQEAYNKNKNRGLLKSDNILPCMCPESIRGVITFAQVSLFSLASKSLSFSVYDKENSSISIGMNSIKFLI